MEDQLKHRREWLREWIERYEAEQAKKSPEQLAAEKAEHEAWLASLPVLPPLPTKPGEVQVIFIKRRPKREG